MRKIYFFSALLVLLGCATAKNLVNRAIKKDPLIFQEYKDTLTINKYIIDSILITKKDTSFFEKIIRVFKFDTIISKFEINIEREKTRQEIRKNARLQRLTVKKDSKIRELELKNEQIQSKLDAKTERKAKRADQKTDRLTVRKENKRRGGFWFWLGLILGGAIGILLKLLFKRIKRYLIK